MGDAAMFAFALREANVKMTDSIPWEERMGRRRTKEVAVQGQTLRYNIPTREVAEAQGISGYDFRNPFIEKQGVGEPTEQLEAHKRLVESGGALATQPPSKYKSTGQTSSSSSRAWNQSTGQSSSSSSRAWNQQE